MSFSGKFGFHLIITVFSAGLIVSCGQTVPAPVLNLSSEYRFDQSNSGSIDSLDRETRLDWVPDYYQVTNGDTLFSIAWRYGFDYRELADINDISADFRIYPGQKIHFAVQQVEPQSSRFEPQKLRVAIRKALGLSIQPQMEERSIASKDLKPSDSSPQSAEVIAGVSSYNKGRLKSTRQTAQKSGNAESSSELVERWLWPVQGRIINRFSLNSDGNKGLDISGETGQPVKAAAPGRVVYRGSALKGYGNLIIVKHNDDFLSAYAHNSQIHVQENEIVKAGQVIADIGNTDTDQSKLHFEIRYRGKPVDPLKYLPTL